MTGWLLGRVSFADPGPLTTVFNNVLRIYDVIVGGVACWDSDCLYFGRHVMKLHSGSLSVCHFRYLLFKKCGGPLSAVLVGICGHAFPQPRSDKLTNLVVRRHCPGSGLRCMNGYYLH